jgi:hypothetical protein
VQLSFDNFFHLDDFHSHFLLITGLVETDAFVNFALRTFTRFVFEVNLKAFQDANLPRRVWCRVVKPLGRGLFID